jgi:hypothetical protein
MDRGLSFLGAQKKQRGHAPFDCAHSRPPIAVQLLLRSCLSKKISVETGLQGIAADTVTRRFIQRIGAKRV